MNAIQEEDPIFREKLLSVSKSLKTILKSIHFKSEHFKNDCNECFKDLMTMSGEYILEIAKVVLQKDEPHKESAYLLKLFLETCEHRCSSEKDMVNEIHQIKEMLEEYYKLVYYEKKIQHDVINLIDCNRQLYYQLKDLVRRQMESTGEGPLHEQLLQEIDAKYYEIADTNHLLNQIELEINDDADLEAFKVSNSESTYVPAYSETDSSYDEFQPRQVDIINSEAFIPALKSSNVDTNRYPLPFKKQLIEMKKDTVYTIPVLISHKGEKKILKERLATPVSQLYLLNTFDEKTAETQNEIVHNVQKYVKEHKKDGERVKIKADESSWPWMKSFATIILFTILLLGRVIPSSVTSAVIDTVTESIVDGISPVHDLKSQGLLTHIQQRTKNTLFVLDSNGSIQLSPHLQVLQDAISSYDPSNGMTPNPNAPSKAMTVYESKSKSDLTTFPLPIPSHTFLPVIDPQTNSEALTRIFIPPPQTPNPNPIPSTVLSKFVRVPVMGQSQNPNAQGTQLSTIPRLVRPEHHDHAPHGKSLSTSVIRPIQRGKNTTEGTSIIPYASSKAIAIIPKEKVNQFYMTQVRVKIGNTNPQTIKIPWLSRSEQTIRIPSTLPIPSQMEVEGELKEVSERLIEDEYIKNTTDSLRKAGMPNLSSIVNTFPRLKKDEIIPVDISIRMTHDMCEILSSTFPSSFRDNLSHMCSVSTEEYATCHAHYVFANNMQTFLNEEELKNCLEKSFQSMEESNASLNSTFRKGMTQFENDLDLINSMKDSAYPNPNPNPNPNPDDEAKENDSTPFQTLAENISSLLSSLLNIQSGVDRDKNEFLQGRDIIGISFILSTMVGIIGIMRVNMDSVKKNQSFFMSILTSVSAFFIAQKAGESSIQSLISCLLSKDILSYLLIRNEYSFSTSIQDSLRSLHSRMCRSIDKKEKGNGKQSTGMIPSPPSVPQRN